MSAANIQILVMFDTIPCDITLPVLLTYIEHHQLPGPYAALMVPLVYGLMPCIVRGFFARMSGKATRNH
jgi:hypothetical protein